MPISKSQPAESTAVRSRPRQRRVFQIALGIWKAISTDNISLLAAGVAFYTLLAIFPGLAFIVAMFGILADSSQVQQELLSLKDVLPAEAWNAIDTQLLALTRQNSTALSLASVISLLLAFINARLGAYAAIGALNVVYKRKETRSFAYTNVLAFIFTIAALVIFAFNVYAVVAVPQVLKYLGFTELSGTIVHRLRWPALTAFMSFSLALAYRYGPARKNSHWRWVTLGSVVATALWLAGSFAFSWYVAQFNSYDRLYGSFGAVVILLYWLWLTAFAALMGAELDMQIHSGLDERN